MLTCLGLLSSYKGRGEQLQLKPRGHKAGTIHCPALYRKFANPGLCHPFCEPREKGQGRALCIQKRIKIEINIWYAPKIFVHLF